MNPDLVGDLERECSVAKLNSTINDMQNGHAKSLKEHNGS